MSTVSTAPEDLTGFVYQSHAASTFLASVNFEERNRILLEIAEAVKQHRNQILEANTLDLEASREMAIPDIVLEWLKLTPERLQNAIDCVKQLAALPDPLSTGNFNPDGYRRVPLGAMAFVYEAFPQLGLVAAAMCLKAGNSLILKGGSESINSNTVIANVIKNVMQKCALHEATLAIAPQGSAIKDLLNQGKYLRLVIPYGRPSFVQQVSKQSTVTVMPSVMGNCYTYIAPSSNLEYANQIIKASRSSDPDPVNAIEKAIVHRDWLDRGLIDWIINLQQQGLTVRGCDSTVAYCRHHMDRLHGEVAAETQWGNAYLDHTIAIKVVDRLDEAIAWMNQYSSGHADLILTDSLQESHQFATQANSSTVFINTSNQFKRCGSLDSNGNKRVILGMSSLKTRGSSRHPGAIDLYSLTTTKRIVTS
jgi:glutamate-5-semialdehyde dehydrogenase